MALPTIAALTPSDWDVEIHDARTTPVDYGKKVDLVGITSYTADITNACKIADGFRSRGVKVVMGGVHVSALPDEALQHADSVVVGEAEAVWKRLLRDCEKGELKKIYKADTLIEMSGMAIPRRDLLDSSMYSSFYSVQATRGCPFNCEFCTVTAFFGQEFRVRPVEDVIEEIKGLNSKEFFFIDDNITGRAGFAKSLFKKLIPLNLKWGGQTTLNFAKDEELLSLYARSGGRYAFIGFETLSDENLRKISKSWNSPDGYREAIKRIHGVGINIVGSFIFGLDGDGPDVFERTFNFIMENKIDAAQFHILTPFPGTKLYDDMVKDGRISDSDWSKYHTGEVVFKPAKMTVRELQEGYWWIFHKTYEMKNILRRSLRSPRGIVYRIGTNLSYRKKARKMSHVVL
ncbi:MAG: hypothetical protein SCABRO_03075 [Candidatus Scalindua brodae]|uniref:Uncharacterized protein n=1 Tax=Candidatus Scalindua brodae TaxID=237368 RepID=A0A0B0EF58_9BACT|nr:MAG: hypothetical protein SCABRO_03075 [Candidatus Scalindua brodae]